MKLLGFGLGCVEPRKVKWVGRILLDVNLKAYLQSSCFLSFGLL